MPDSVISYSLISREEIFSANRLESAVRRLLKDRSYGAGVIAEAWIDTEVPDGLVDFAGREDLYQRIVADIQFLGGRDLHPVLAGEHFHLGGNHVFVLRNHPAAADVQSADDADGVALIHLHNGETGLHRVRAVFAI